jgi:phosphate-selective porin OprO/OprP
MALQSQAGNASPTGAKKSLQVLVLCLITAAALVGRADRSHAQQFGYQPVSYPSTGPTIAPAPMMAPAPTWEDFNSLAARLQATEARLQSLSNGVSNGTNYETSYDYYQPSGQPSGQSALSATTQTPDNYPAILSRLNTLEQSYQADKARLPLVRMTGFAQLDQGFFGQDAQSRANLGDIQDGVGFRRARLQAVGNLSEFTRYSFEMDFAVPGRPSFMDVWGEQTNVPFFGNVRIGHFRQPTTMDAWTSIRHLEFLERSLPFQAMDPFRRVGIMSWFNAGEDDRTLIAYSVYGTGLSFANSAGVPPSNATLGDTRFGTQIGDNGGVSAAIRGSHLLYYDPYADNRYLLHIGGGYNFSEIGGAGGRGPNARTYEARAIPEFFVGDPAGGASPPPFGNAGSGTPFVADTGRFLANDFHFFHTELAGNYGSAHFQTEYMGTLVDQLGGPAVYYHGAYVQCGYFLTGESCGYNKQMGALDYNVKPFREFFGLGRDQWFCGWGAWEIAARYSYLNLASTGILPANQLSAAAGPPPAPNPGIVNDATLALNWWWNQFTRLQFNYIYVNQNPNAAATGITNIYAARFQFEF